MLCRGAVARSLRELANRDLIRRTIERHDQIHPTYDVVDSSQYGCVECGFSRSVEDSSRLTLRRECPECDRVRIFKEFGPRERVGSTRRAAP